MRVYKGVELARVGRFNASTGPVTLTTEDFDNIAHAYNELKGKVDIPVKLGHEDDQKTLRESGQPAAGWVENVRRDGDRLVADLVNVPDAVAALIESGALRKRSIEAARNIELAGKRYAFALVGLALLGSELPAVDSLDDIAALYASGKVVASSDITDTETTVYMFSSAVEAIEADQQTNEKLLQRLEALVGEIEQATKGVKGAPRLREILKIGRDLLKGSKVKAEMELDELRTMLELSEDATEDDIKNALKERLTAKQESKQEANTGETDQLKAEVTKLNTELIKLQNEGATTKATAKVDDAIKAGKFVPASRDSLIKLALHDSESFDKLAESTPANAAIAQGERGNHGDDSVPEVTEAELAIALASGVSKTDYIKQKAADQGITLPANFGSTDGDKKSS